jgi:hypothetical protein
MADLATLAPWRMSLRGVTIGGGGNPYRFDTVPEGIDMPDVTSSFTPFAQADGGYLQGDRHGERVLSGTILVYPSDRGSDALWRAVETIKAVFSRSSMDIPLELRVGDGRPVRVMGRPTRCQLQEYDALNGRAIVAWQFRCADPLLRADTRRVSFQPASGTAFTGRTYPRTYPLSYGGVIPGTATGRVTLANDGNYRVGWVAEFLGPVASPQLTHLATGRTVRWLGEVLAGQRLTIDSTTRAVLLDGDPAYWLLGGIPDWWFLEPGTNEVSYSAATGNGACEFAYTPAWL